MAPKTYKREKEREAGITFSKSYSLQFNKITSIMRKYLPVFFADETMGQVLRSPVRFVARRVSTVGNVVSPNLFPWKKRGSTTWLSIVGFRRCGHNKCCACHFASVGKTFSSTSLPELPPFMPPFNINSYINCSSKWVVYLIGGTVCRVHLEKI